MSIDLVKLANWREKINKSAAAITAAYTKIPAGDGEPIFDAIRSAATRKYVEYMTLYDKIHDMIREIENTDSNLAELRRETTKLDNATCGVDRDSLLVAYEQCIRAIKRTSDKKSMDAIDMDVSRLTFHKSTFTFGVDAIVDLEREIVDMHARIWSICDDLIDAKLAVYFADYICDHLRYIKGVFDCDATSDYARVLWKRLETALGTSTADKAVISVAIPYIYRYGELRSQIEGCISLRKVSDSLSAPDIPATRIGVDIRATNRTTSTDGLEYVTPITGECVPTAIQKAVADLASGWIESEAKDKKYSCYRASVVGFNSAKAK